MLLPPSGQIFLWNTKTRRSVCVRVYVRVHTGTLSCFSPIWLCVTSWIVSNLMVAISSSRGIFLTKGSIPSLLGLLNWQVDSLLLVPPVKPQDRPKHSQLYFSLVAQMVKNLSACNVGDPGLVLYWKDTLEKGMTTHSSILAWRIPWIEEPGEL